MKVTGIVEKIDTSQKQAAIKIDVKGAAKPLWVPPELHPQIRDLKEGGEETFEVADTMRWYYVFRSWERASAQNKQEPPESPRTEKGPKPPKTFTPTREKDLPPTSGKGRACSARFMAKFRELVKKGLSPAELVDELCLQEREIYHLISALETKEKVQSIAPDIDTDFDRVRPTHWMKISQAPQEKQVELAREVAEKNLSVKQLDEKLRGEVRKEVQSPPLPFEESLDQGIVIRCKTCPATFHFLHLPNGKHKLESVEVNEK